MPTRKKTQQKTESSPAVDEKSPPETSDEDEELRRQESGDLGNVSTFTVKLTRMELAHLRDLFGIKLPPDMTVSVSEALAESQSRPLVESKLWQKLAKAMAASGIPMEEDCPDFTILPSGPAPLGVFQVEATDDQLRAMIAAETGMTDSSDEDNVSDEEDDS